ncbi:MAG TPA: dienelactone hydrolase family protein [Microbacteriaceae bacterium]|nr:dienelactone hydrolase family protein [Microbacteriaceae bacterium]
MGSMETIGGVTAYRAEPAGEPRGAIIVIHEIWGLVDQIKGVADRWAAEGYLAIAPDILTHVGITPEVGEALSPALKHPDEEVRTAMQPKLREALAPIRQPEYAAWALAQLSALLDELEEIPGIAGRIAVTGFCFGGTYSYALAAQDDRVSAAVPFYGTAPTTQQIQDISCPVLALYGEIDPPLMEKLPEVREAMAAADIDFTDVVYPGALHAFFNETNARTYHPEFAADAWAKATAFVADRVG